MHRVWREANLRPHRLERYQASNDPDVEAQAADIIGLYLHPPRHAAIFCVDEKSAIPALDRRDRVLPLSPGRVERHGFEYKRHGTLSLYAALNTQTGAVQGPTTARHTSQDFVEFLGEVVASCDPDQEILHHPRQPLGSQNPEGGRVLRAASQRQSPLHAHLFVVAESNRVVVLQGAAATSSRAASSPPPPIWPGSCAATSMPTPSMPSPVPLEVFEALASDPTW